MRALIGKVILLPPSSVTSRIDFCHEKKKKKLDGKQWFCFILIIGDW